MEDTANIDFTLENNAAIEHLLLPEEEPQLDILEAYLDGPPDQSLTSSGAVREAEAEEVVEADNCNGDRAEKKSPSKGTKKTRNTRPTYISDLHVRRAVICKKVKTLRKNAEEWCEIKIVVYNPNSVRKDKAETFYSSNIVPIAHKPGSLHVMPATPPASDIRSPPPQLHSPSKSLLSVASCSLQQPPTASHTQPSEASRRYMQPAATFTFTQPPDIPYRTPATPPIPFNPSPPYHSIHHLFSTQAHTCRAAQTHSHTYSK